MVPWKMGRANSLRGLKRRSMTLKGSIWRESRDLVYAGLRSHRNLLDMIFRYELIKAQYKRNMDSMTIPFIPMLSNEMIL
jgi:hypothetical protein